MTYKFNFYDQNICRGFDPEWIWWTTKISFELYSRYVKNILSRAECCSAQLAQISSSSACSLPLGLSPSLGVCFNTIMYRFWTIIWATRCVALLSLLKSPPLLHALHHNNFLLLEKIVFGQKVQGWIFALCKVECLLGHYFPPMWYFVI